MQINYTHFITNIAAAEVFVAAVKSSGHGLMRTFTLSAGYGGSIAAMHQLFCAGLEKWILPEKVSTFFDEKSYTAKLMYVLYSGSALAGITAAVYFGSPLLGLEGLTFGAATGVFALTAIAETVATISFYFFSGFTGSNAKEKLKIEETPKIESHKKPEPKNDIHQFIFQKVRETLDILFADSPYSIETLPVYPHILDKDNHPSPLRKEMTSKVMIGKSVDRRVFIALKVDCDTCANDEDSDKIVILYQTYKDLCWEELEGLPNFFNSNFTCPRSGQVTTSQEENFKAVQKLIKTGESTDIRGRVWRLSEN